MAENNAQTPAEVRKNPAFDLSLEYGKFKISLKINDVLLAAGAVATGVVALYCSNNEGLMQAVKNALQKTILGVVDPIVTKIIDGHSVLVELCCKTERSFLTFLDDFDKKVVKFRLEEELKQIGSNSDFEVTICNKKEIDEQASQIRNNMDWHSSEKLVNFKYEERELQIKQKTVHAESRIKQDNDLELRGMVQELKSENEFLRQELERMKKEIERLQCEKTDLTPAVPGGEPSARISLVSSWPPEEVSIKLSPTSPNIQAGSKVEFQCTVRGCEQVFYRWSKDGQVLSGEETSTLILDPVKVQDFGIYECAVRNDKHKDSSCLKSKAVELDVKPAVGKRYRTLAEAFDSDLNLKLKVAMLLEEDTDAYGKAYRKVAFHYQMSNYGHLGQRKTPGEDVLNFLQASHPDLNVYDFCKVLKREDVRRLDIVNELVAYLIR